MIAIAFLILPVLVIEFFLHDRVEGSVVLWSLLHVGTGIIWLAFAIEFILMVSVAEKKIAYCKDHWLDLAILLLPLISFLRSIQFIRATNALRLPQFTKMLRVYRMRGTALKALRGLIVLDLFSRFFKADPDQLVEQVRAELREAEAKVRMIRRKLTKAQQEVLASARVIDQEASRAADDALPASKAQGGQSATAEVGAEQVKIPAGLCNSKGNSSGEHLGSKKTQVMRSTTVVGTRPK